MLGTVRRIEGFLEPALGILLVGKSLVHTVKDYLELI